MLVSHYDATPVLKLAEKHQECAICKIEWSEGEEATSLPCTHCFHPACIEQWLSQRNFCPLCRYELTTDDPDYESKKAQQQETPQE